MLERPPPPWRDDWAVFLDVDGTLLEIAPTPAAVRVPPSLPRLLAELAQRLGGAVALISGRPIAELDRLLAPVTLPTAGLHGLEHRDAAGRIRRSAREPALEQAATALAAFADREPGVLVEDKGPSIALHYRGASASETRARALVSQLLTDLGERFELQEGKKVLEIKPCHADKGAAIRSFLLEPPFVGREPCFVGDDVTDEDGFAAVNALGGHSIAVGRHGGPTQATYGLSDVDAVLEWLESADQEASQHA